MTQRPPGGGSPGGRLGRTARIATAALAVYAALAPIGVSAIGAAAGPASLTPLIATLVLALLLLGPSLAAIVMALRGLGAIAEEMAARPEGEPRQAILRIFAGAAVLAYLGLLAFLGAPVASLLPLLAIWVPSTLCAWLLLVHLIVGPGQSRARRAAAMVNDVAFLSAFLHLGGALAAPWVALYFAVILGHGFRFGLPSLVAAVALCALGFAAVVMVTPYWGDLPAVSAGIGVAFPVLGWASAGRIRRLRAAVAQAEEAHAAKTRFLAIMSHELRTPLHTLMGLTSLISRTELNAEQREVLATMQFSARTLLGLVNDLLDLSKLESGKLPPKTERFVLREVLGAAIAILRPQAEAKGLRLALSIEPRLPHVYRGLPLQLRQVVANLLGNAIKFSERGLVSVAASLAARQGDSVRLRIAVRDEGVGIPAAARDRIFESFTQADEAVTRRFGGSGLGLAIAKQLLDMMGGTIAVESEVGKGSTFTIEVPVSCETEGSVRPPDLLGRQIVLVTRDPELAATLQAALAGWRGETEWHLDGQAALAAVAAKAGPVLVVLDGRDSPLPALSMAHHLAGTVRPAPLIIFVPPAQGGEAIAALAAPQLAAVIEAPVTEEALAATLLGVLAANPRSGAQPESEARPKPAALPPPAATRPLRVLIADDDPASCAILRTQLERAGHWVEVAKDGEMALAALEKARFDLAILDLNMPEIGGEEVARLHRLTHAGEPRLPIVALTADASAETARRCREASMDAILTKPVEPEPLLAAVDEICARMSIPDRASEGDAPLVVTPISAHPRFAADSGEAVDEGTVEALRALGGKEFLADVVESFREDARRLLAQLRQAAERGELRQFRETLHSLRSSASNMGGVRLCQILTSLSELPMGELRRNAGLHLDRVEGELARLELTLEQAMRGTRAG